MYNPQTHYRAMFSIEKAPSSSEPHAFQILVGHIGRWLRTHEYFKESGDQIFKPWLFQGDRKLSGKSGAWVEVRTLNYSLDTRSPEAWVMRFEHYDRDYKQRKWRTDISVTCRDEIHAQLSVKVTRFLNANYLGEEPPIPPSSVPRFVSTILRDDSLKCFVGTRRLDSQAIRLTPGDGRSLHQFLVSKERILPVVLINLNYLREVLSPDGLQNVILGSGIVYWYDEPTVHSALAYEWGAKYVDHYQCGKDSVRIYLPALSTARWLDSNRHRYIPLAKFEGASADLLRIISQGIFRITSTNLQDGQITDFESLYFHNQRQRLVQLRQAAAASGTRTTEELEYLSALEEENTEVTNKFKEAQNQLSAEQEQNVFLELQLEETQDQLRRSQAQFSAYSITENQYKKALGDQQDKRQVWRRLPRTLAEDLRQMAELFPEKIAVLDAAYESAEDAKFQAVHEAHELLFEMANTLHSIFFDADEGDKEGVFKSSTGFEITMNESSSTKADKRLMNLRKRVYEGQEEDFSPHAKLEKGGKDLRVHFFVDNLRKLIVIGHCGDHLETAGTARRKNG
jgi:hypothetical protein